MAIWTIASCGGVDGLLSGGIGRTVHWPLLNGQAGPRRRETRRLAPGYTMHAKKRPGLDLGRPAPYVAGGEDTLGGPPVVTRYARSLGDPVTRLDRNEPGSGDHGTRNDVAVLWPLMRRPIIVAAYLTGATVSADDRDAALAEVGHIVSRML